MNAHYHIGFISLLITAAELVIILFFAKWFTTRYSETHAARGLAYILD